MRGSIRTKVKGKRYEIRVALGLDPKTARYRQKSLTVRGTRAEAERALRRLLEEVEVGAHEDKAQGSVTFGELLDEWLAFKVAADRSPTTIARYRASIELHLRHAAGNDEAGPPQDEGLRRPLPGAHGWLEARHHPEDASCPETAERGRDPRGHPVRATQDVREAAPRPVASARGDVPRASPISKRPAPTSHARTS